MWTFDREARQEQRLLERGVAAADDRDLLVAEEEAVAGRAGGDAAAAQPRLALEAQPDRRRAGRDDDRLGRVLDAAGPDPERPLPRGRPRSTSTSTMLRAEALRLGAEQLHQLGALDAVGEARVVLDVGGDHQLAARRGAGEHDRLEVGPRGVDRRRQARRARSRR